eukprot:gene11719-12789_t
MSIFNRIAKSVGDAAEIGKLDAIVDRRVQQYDREIDKLTQDIRRLPSEEEIKKMEQDVIDRCLFAAVNADWKEGGGNNLELRKRVLNRELQKRRGKLSASMDDLRASTQFQLDTIVVAIRQAEQEIKTALPTDLPTIEGQFVALRQKLGGVVGPNFPGGLAQFDAIVDGAVEDQLSALKEFILDENKRIREFIENVADIRNLDAIVDRRVQQYDREINQKIQALRRHLSQEEIDNIEQEIIDRCLFAYDKEAGGYMGKAVNADWKEKRRGKLSASMAIRQVEQEIKATLPNDLPTIEGQFVALRQKLGGVVGPNFPGGLAQFDAIVDGAVEAQLNTLKSHILSENERITAEAINEFRQESFNILFNSLYVQITQTTNVVKRNIGIDVAHDPDNKVITPEVVDRVRRDMDRAVSSFLNDLRRINQI